MTIQMVNGFPVYAVTRKEVEYHPSFFQQQAEKWVEGSKREKLSDEELEAIYLGVIPLDESKINPAKPEGVLTKCDVSDRRYSAFGNIGGMGTMLAVGGFDSYKIFYEYSKAATDVDVEKSEHFQDYRKFLDILEQLKA